MNGQTGDNPFADRQNTFPDQLDKLIINASIATFSEDSGYRPGSDRHNEYGSIEHAAIAIHDGKIVWLGTSDQAAEAIRSGRHAGAEVLDIQQQWITPGLIDCHTHLVYGGNRSNEFEARLKGATYTEIAQAGGGILATVQATRHADETELYRQSEKRLQALLAEGVTSVEIKSGYGLDLASEEKMLRVARKLGEDYGITVKKTCLAAHALPPEYQDNADAYIDKVCEWLPILYEKGLVDAVDGFIEAIAFDLAQITRVFATAKALGIPVKLHSEQLTNMGGSRLVSEYRGLSSDHLEQLQEEDIEQMAKSDTVAVLLPGAFYMLRDETVPPISLLRKHRVPMAVATDCNPGTSPVTSLLLMMNMACTLFDLTPEEALAGTTRNGAKALGMTNKGQISVGMDADLAVWDIERPADLSYLVGLNPLTRTIINGR
ncbi:MAG: imidazolonepropionase [Gammaproteobacteria bacterium]|nr:MAG: imidazolonepropionase [Pseudomonadota bacterium]PIE38561.1 MAG: imidazolonepropionase [Gammaproteobacteria bacterium]